MFVPAAHGGAIQARAGELLAVVDVEGGQVADFVALPAGDWRKAVSAHQTRSSLRRLTLRVGDRLVDWNREPVLEIVRDDVGVHDLLFCACSPALYRQRFNLMDHRSCRMNLLEALTPHGIEEWQIPDPVNLFMRTPPRPDGEFDFLPFQDLDGSVREDIEFLQATQLLDPETLIRGFVYDVTTGKLREVRVESEAKTG